MGRKALGKGWRQGPISFWVWWDLQGDAAKAQATRINLSFSQNTQSSRAQALTQPQGV